MEVAEAAQLALGLLEHGLGGLGFREPFAQLFRLLSSAPSSLRPNSFWMALSCSRRKARRCWSVKAEKTSF
jgi:hypothetical protein